MPPKSRKKDAESQHKRKEGNGADGDGGIDDVEERQRNLENNEDAHKESQSSNLLQPPKSKAEEKELDNKKLTPNKVKTVEEKTAEKKGAEGGGGQGANEPKEKTEQAQGEEAEKRSASKSEENTKNSNITGGNEGIGDNKKVQSISINFRWKGILLAAAAFAVIAVIAYLPQFEGDVKSNFDLVKDFGGEVDKLQWSFINQTDRFWKILKSRGLAHLQDKDPLQPLVFLLAAPPAAHEWVDCLAIQLAEKLDPRHQRTLARIYGEKEKGNPPDTTKKTMDNFLKEKFEAGHRVALIHHLELLPPLSPLLFYRYCDDQNAPHKHVAIIFTVHMPVEPSPSLSPKEAEESVEEYLSGEVWAKVDKDAVAALLSRIADIVVLMNGESSGSAKELCSLSSY